MFNFCSLLEKPLESKLLNEFLHHKNGSILITFYFIQLFYTMKILQPLSPYHQPYHHHSVYLVIKLEVCID